MLRCLSRSFQHVETGCTYYKRELSLGQAECKNPSRRQKKERVNLLATTAAERTSLLPQKKGHAHHHHHPRTIKNSQVSLYNTLTPTNNLIPLYFTRPLFLFLAQQLKKKTPCVQIVLATDLAHGFEYVARFTASTNNKGGRRASIVPDMGKEGLSSGGIGQSMVGGVTGGVTTTGKGVAGKDPLQAQILLMQMVIKASVGFLSGPPSV